MKKPIAIDCDDVLAETIDALLEYYNYNINGKSITRNDVIAHEFDNIKAYNYSFEERYKKDLDFFLNHDALYKIKPVIGSKEKLLKFKEMWHRLYMVTGRPDELKQHTYDWVEMHYPNLFEDIYFLNLDKVDGIPKSEICLKLDVEFLVDDDIRFARDVAEKWIKVYLLDKPWNREYNESIDKWIVKIKNWNEIVF